MTATCTLKVDLWIDTARFQGQMFGAIDVMKRLGVAAHAAGLSTNRLLVEMTVAAEERKARNEALRRWAARPQFSRPGPLAIDGHEYHRRRQARQHRKRNR